MESEELGMYGRCIESLIAGFVGGEGSEVWLSNAPGMEREGDRRGLCWVEDSNWNVPGGGMGLGVVIMGVGRELERWWLSFVSECEGHHDSLEKSMNTDIFTGSKTTVELKEDCRTRWNHGQTRLKAEQFMKRRRQIACPVNYYNSPYTRFKSSGYPL